MKHINIYIILSTVFILTFKSVATSTINSDTLYKFKWERDIHSNGTCEKSIALPNNIGSVRFKEFQNGNGQMIIGDQIFYIIDGHGDGATYETSILEVEFIDLNSDGYMDFICSGLVEYMSDIDDEIYEREAVVFIYLYNQKEKRFGLKYKKSSFDLEEPNDASNKWWERYSTLPKYKKFRELDMEKDK